MPEMPILPPAILAENLSKTYDGTPAVDGLSFTIEAGAVVGLLGGNGAGKTTTLAMIMGLTTPTEGSVRVFGADMAQERIAELASELDLADFLDRRTGQLSAGQKTRVALAKALINEPDLLLLDEPTASLDPDTADWVRGHLEAFRKRRGATILLASHNMGEVERLCDRVIIMKRGRIEDDDTPVKLLARYGRRTLEEVFLDVARGRAMEAAQ